MGASQSNANGESSLCGGGGGVFSVEVEPFHSAKRAINDFLFLQVNVAVVGLDNAGKSTIINHLKEFRVNTQDITPTVGFKREIIHWAPENCQITIYDMSGDLSLCIETS